MMDAPTSLAALPPQSLLDATGPLAIATGEVHLWAFASGRGSAGAAALRERCAGVLDEAERKRAARFRCEQHQHDYIVFHALLRSVLARYLGLEARALRFSVAPEGKPAIDGLGFNLSHSADRALLAVTGGEAVGADLELERDDLDALALADRYFYGAELEAVRAAAGSSVVEGRRSFFRHWVAKEAVLKGVGIGLGFPLDRFGVHFARGGGSARIVSLDPVRLEPDWCIRMLEVGAGCPGAVALRSESFTVLVAAEVDRLRAD
jgi:4'-phosphopantetheinyl transferase